MEHDADILICFRVLDDSLGRRSLRLTVTLTNFSHFACSMRNVCTRRCLYIHQRSHLLAIRKLRNKRFLVRQLDQLLGVARRCVYVLAVLTPNFSVGRSMYALCFILITRVSRLRSVSISRHHMISLRSLMLNSSFSALLMPAM